MKPPEDVKRELVQRWLLMAEQDFGAAKHLLSEKALYLGAACFHAQQAAEKFLKAVLIHNQIDFPKTHNIGELLDLIAHVNQPMADSLRDATALNPYGMDVRYPGDFPEVTLEDARKAVKLAEKVRNKVRFILKEYE